MPAAALCTSAGKTCYDVLRVKLWPSSPVTKIICLVSDRTCSNTRMLSAVKQVVAVLGHVQGPKVAFSCLKCRFVPGMPMGGKFVETSIHDHQR
ncbi:hypothetical protein VTI74DRAFT_3390 [Chaetomium olivicolor]